MQKDKKIKSVDLVFENCDVATVEYNDIHNMHVVLSNRTIHIAWGFNGGSFWDHLHASFIAIDIFRLDQIPFSPNGTTETKLLDRVKYPDITHIQINYEDGEFEYVSVPYKLKDRYSSIYQTVSYEGKRTNWNLPDNDNVCPEQDVYRILITKKGFFKRQWRLFKENVQQPSLWFYNYRGKLQYSTIYYMYRYWNVKIQNFFYYRKHPK